MYESVRAVAIVTCGLALFVALIAGNWALAFGSAILVALLLSAGRRNADDGGAKDQESVPNGILSGLAEELLDVPLKWHALGFAALGMLLIFSVVQYGGIDGGSLVMGVLMIGFGMFLTIGHLRRRMRNPRDREE